jgi:hypothetical protein
VTGSAGGAGQMENVKIRLKKLSELAESFRVAWETWLTVYYFGACLISIFFSVGALQGVPGGKTILSFILSKNVDKPEIL